MDPNSNLEEQRELANTLLDGILKHQYDSLDQYEGDVDRLCELVIALDEWISKGGFLPSRWKK